jgi:hypothetical protein
VLAIGSITNDFGTPGARQNCIFLDDRHAADRFRNRLLNHCLRACAGDEAAMPPPTPASGSASSAPGRPASSWPPSSTTPPRRSNSTG